MRTSRLFSLLSLVTVTAVPALALAADGGADIAAEGWLAAYLLAFTAGIGTSLTPCVFPMIPIIVGVFGARDQAVNRRRATLLASCYVLGMGLLYSALGVVFALLGKTFGTILANPWVVFPIVGLYALLAASMFGAFELRLPYALQQRLNSVGGTGYGGAFGLGLVGGLTAAPCTGPILAGIMGFVFESQNVFAGFSLMFTYALGMGVLFFAVAVFAVSLPKSGSWMETVKSVGGIALIVAGAYFLRPVIPALGRLTSPEYGFLIGAATLAIIGFGIGAAHLSFHGSAGERVRKAIGISLAVVGLVGAVNWALTPRNPLPWRTDVPAALAEAQSAGKGILLDFSAEWCAPCKELEKITFSDPAVYEEIERRFIPVKVDMTTETPDNKKLSDSYAAATLPAVILLAPDGSEVSRVVAMMGPDEFLARLKNVATD